MFNKNYKISFLDSVYVVDGVSSFGAIPVDIKKANIDFLITCSNKCIQSVPGFAIVICDKNKLLSFKSNKKFFIKKFFFGRFILFLR
jgi:aspartate aminotransferase-like enzyme